MKIALIESNGRLWLALHNSVIDKICNLTVNMSLFEIEVLGESIHSTWGESQPCQDLHTFLATSGHVPADFRYSSVSSSATSKTLLTNMVQCLEGIIASDYERISLGSKDMEVLKVVG